MTTIILLTLSNIFMTFAWYGHLRYRNAPLFRVIVISWLIAFAEYCFQVPANRIGAKRFTVTQLKIMQERITLAIFYSYGLLTVLRAAPVEQRCLLRADYRRRLFCLSWPAQGA